MINERSNGVIIFIKEKEINYLLLHYESGHWDFVKGNVEKDETEKDTIIRETKEETGIQDLKFIPGFKENMHFFYKRGDLVSKSVTYLLAETKTKKVTISHEHIGYKWLNYDEALKQITFKSSKEILKKANEMLNNSLLNY